jgi:hypothetical protein
MKTLSHLQRRKNSGLFTALRRGIAGLVACTLLNACTTTRPLAAAELVHVSTLVQVGDTVACALRDGTSKTFKVTAVEPAALSGKNVRLAVEDIAHISIRRFSAKKTLIFSATVVGIGLLMMATHWPNPHIAFGPGI